MGDQTPAGKPPSKKSAHPALTGHRGSGEIVGLDQEVNVSGSEVFQLTRFAKSAG